MLKQPPFELLIFSALKRQDLALADAFAIQANMQSMQQYLREHYWDCLVEYVLADKKGRMIRLLNSLASPGAASGCFGYALVDGEEMLYINDEGLDALVSDRLVSYIQNYWLKRHPGWAEAAYTARVDALNLAEVLDARSKYGSGPYQLSLF